MASALSRSPIELPPRSQGSERSRIDTPPSFAAPAARRPVSFGLLLLGLGVTWLVSLTLGGVLLQHAELHAVEANRTLERRLGQQLGQLTASMAVLEEQQQLRSQRHDGQAVQLERLSTELDALRARPAHEMKVQRTRRRERH